ncbi:MAG TPA: ABC transporter ATP-binding protein [Candidatus Gallimonas intestinavium]|uniref:ABC transporter ATP-binding protein n=1 Tax=Candidatus Gallimonas intestinavium TaxID=2838603 RepID=A0A9D2G492_9FIRM|nr:ABC transporter ATP-binding protein [Candidatus Gallimonas intestinavium]
MEENAIVRAEGLRKTFTLSQKQQKLEKTAEKRKVAVDGLSFSAYRGEIYGLLGPNGAGKTTTLRILSTLIRPDAGDAFVDGCSVLKEGEKVRDKIGFMTSELKLEGFFTPSYLFDFFGAMHGVDKTALAARKQELFARFGIDRFAEVKVSDLSTGMLQKVSLVVSIVHDPEVVIFDEPTNGLDVLTAKVVTDFLIELKNMGKSILLSTHIFSLVEKLCDRVGIIIDGRMAAEGTLEELCDGISLEDKFFEIYRSIKGEIV